MAGEQAPAWHAITRVRRETRRRLGMVASVERLSPGMLRIWFEGPDFHDFESAAPDDHVKLFVPGDDGELAMRDYTPRLFDTAAGRLAIEFAIHDAGPATRWALQAKVGDTLQIGGPRGSAIVPDDFDWVLLIGDETALPASARRLEEVSPDVPVIALIAIDKEGDQVPLAERGGLTVQWFPRAGSDGDEVQLRRALDGLALPPGDGFVWIATEGEVARALRTHVVDVLGHPREWLKASGYWLAESAGTHMKIDD